ncbi:biotin/lipoyl-binding protein [Lichenicoccus roseus]|uniref:HlyD family secretion protein n=1 Tax=Lichenicoccus roseus TaxID=2683649 RepID=A0A5R9JC06_9PROT|nr:HlyD family secretion protein [Lichenicoccus roseus]TLU72916.1 HlyD family secretion protein [Lichenicoccus roseus]
MFKRARVAMRVTATLFLVAVALVVAGALWRYYTAAPWTRDGTVRVQVANIAPQISGQITELHVHDNQVVHRGDVLYVIDPFDFRVSLAEAQATAQERDDDMRNKQAEAARRQALTTLSTSVEEKQTYRNTAEQAAAAYAAAVAQLNQAKINLERTNVRSTVNGVVTNLLMRVGDYATTGTANVQVVDTDSFWIDGYFEETKLGAIHIGDRAEALLMGYRQPVIGHVQSITLGISNANATPSTQGLPSVNPVYTWVRLAQRVPVRIHIDTIPGGIVLVAGMTATVGIVASPATRN